MRIFVNDQVHEVEKHSHLDEVLERFGAQPPFAVALNTEFVPRSRYAQHLLQADDRIEIVQPLQGG